MLVEPGELLVGVDDREYQLQLDRARSLLAGDEAQLRQLDVEERNCNDLIEIATNELEIAERERARVLALFESGQAPRRELDVAVQGYEQARRALQTPENDKALLPEKRAARLANRDLHRADAALAQLNVERCRVCAPFRGRLEAVQAEIGQRINIGSQLVALLDPDLIEIPIELPVSLRERVTGGAACRLTLESNRDVAWDGRVARIAPRADEATRTFALFVEVDNTAQQQPLMPGVFLRARIDGPVWRDALVLSRGTVQDNCVYVYDNGLARRKEVRTDRQLLDQAIISGLRPGETVITSNLDALFDGAPVRIQRDEKASLATGASPGDSTSDHGVLQENALDETPVRAHPSSETVPGS